MLLQRPCGTARFRIRTGLESNVRIALSAWATCFGLVIAASQAVSADDTVLYSFQGGTADGADPTDSLIDARGILYGTTAYGGTQNNGTVFAFSLSKGTERILHSFGDDADDGTKPFGKVTKIGGVLYGTASNGGSYGGGTIFAVDRKTGSEEILHSFGGSGHGDGEGPETGLTNVRGTLYGTTTSGGTYDQGIVFSFDPDSQSYNVLHSFCTGMGCDNAGGDPHGDLLYRNGILYGTTSGASGTVYRVDLSTRTETRLYYFCQKTGCADGEYPSAGLIMVNGDLYGTTSAGGAYGYGTVFRLNPATSKETVLYSFWSGSDGALPLSALLDVNGVLYGTTGDGGGYGCGGYGCGTVFAFDPATRAESVVHAFSDTPDGGGPGAALIDINGSLYGTTEGGGSYRYGTVFSITPVD